MKYGIPVNGKVTEPVTIPQSKEGNPLAWLAVQFPGYSGWQPVADDCVPGATYNGPGDTINPQIVLAKGPLTLSSTAFQDVCETGLGGNATGRARFGAIIKAMAASADNEVIAVNKRFEKSITFDKQKTAAMLTLLIAKGIASLTTQERTSILDAWPEG